MVARTSFFVASLWAPLPPVAMMVAACVWVMFFPGSLGFGAGARDAAGIALIAVPCVYTALFGAAYLTARALHALHVLSVWALLALCLVASSATAGLFWVSEVVERNVLLLTGIVFAGTLVALVSASLVWWRVGTKTPPLVATYEKRRSRSRRSVEGTNVGVVVENPAAARHEVLSDELIVRWDPNVRRLEIVHPDRSRYPEPLATFDDHELDAMSARDAPGLIGEPFTRLMPTLRSRYAAPTDANDGGTTERDS